MTKAVQDLISACSGMDVIACGTGAVGKFVIPYLMETLRIRGVTNSHITADDAGSFSDTGLPIRSLQAWHDLLPEAAILVTTTNRTFQGEISHTCEAAGFRNIFYITESLENDLLSTQLNAYIPPSKMAFFERLLPQVEEYFLDWMCLANEIRDTHRMSFSEFRGCHSGQTVAIIATGPSLNYYSRIAEVVHIGVNTAFLKPGIELKYYFAEDYIAKQTWFQDLKNYNFIKFFGISGHHSAKISELYRIPESLIEENHGRRYFRQENRVDIHCNIETHTLMNFGSVAFSAFHFALHTTPKRILLVGCDCSCAGHYDGSDKRDLQYMIKGWQTVKEFMGRYYPGIEVISVNPVGLKGLFHDMYTESYLDAHPEIDRSASRILKPEELQN